MSRAVKGSSSQCSGRMGTTGHLGASSLWYVREPEGTAEDRTENVGIENILKWKYYAK